jgi:tetratricopeptide (TPR) repeat protein
MNAALAIYERHDRHREIAHVCCNIGNVYLKKSEYALAQTFLQRSLHLAERIGDIPLMSVVFHNLGELAASSGDLAKAETLCRRSLIVAEQVNDREYQSLWNADLASILQESKVEEAKVYVCRALKIGRAIHNTPCIGLALVVLGSVRIVQAKALEGCHSERSEESGLERTSPRFLRSARLNLERALALEGLEAETRTRGHLGLAQISLSLGEVEIARQQVLQAMEEARSYELMSLVAQCERLLEEILVQKL